MKFIGHRVNSDMNTLRNYNRCGENIEPSLVRGKSISRSGDAKSCQYSDDILVKSHLPASNIVHLRIEKHLLDVLQQISIPENFLKIEADQSISFLSISGREPDNLIIRYNPRSTLQLSDRALRFAVFHEIAHLVNGDLQRPAFWEVCAFLSATFTATASIQLMRLGTGISVSLDTAFALGFVFIGSACGLWASLFSLKTKEHNRREFAADKAAVGLSGDVEGGMELFEQLNEIAPIINENAARSGRVTTFERKRALAALL